MQSVAAHGSGVMAEEEVKAVPLLKTAVRKHWYS